MFFLTIQKPQGAQTFALNYTARIVLYFFSGWLVISWSQENLQMLFY